MLWVCWAGKDVFWYTREKQDDGDAARAELLAVKQREEDLMAEVCSAFPLLQLYASPSNRAVPGTFTTSITLLNTLKVCMLHAQALGIKPKTIRAPKQPSLDQKDLQQLMQKEEEEEAAEGGDREAERIKGLGFTV